MRISSLIKREPFYKILSETLGNIYPNERLKVWLGIKNKPQIRFANEYLNFIASKNTSSEALKNLYNEYSFTDVIWRKYPQKIWAYLSTHKLFRKAFSQKRLELKYSIQDDIIILGGNHRLRFYDFKKSEMLVFLKAKENPKLIENEIELRSNSNFIHMPNIIESGKDWFIESSVKGVPVNRLSPENRDELKKKILACHYDLLIAPSMEVISMQEYTKSVQKEFENYQLSDLGISKETFEPYFRFINSSAHEICISQTHGDFQEGNILVEDKINPIVIDWECTDRRFFLYDDFVLWSNIRTVLFSDDMFDMYYKEMLPRHTKNNKLICDIISNKGLVKSLLIIEELKFQLYNQLSRKNVLIDESFRSRIARLIQVLN